MELNDMQKSFLTGLFLGLMGTICAFSLILWPPDFHVATALIPLTLLALTLKVVYKITKNLGKAQV